MSYADLFDSRRFPSADEDEDEDVPPEIQFTADKLEGDAEVIARGRVGSVYRKTIRGVDVACKVLRIGERAGGEEEWCEVLKELRREAEAYARLRPLQGVRVPRFLTTVGYLGGCVQILATEYAGVSLEEFVDEEKERVPRELAAAALAALDAVHARGVLHGDVALRNFVVRRESDGAVLLLDFGFAVFREEVPREDEWLERVRAERVSLAGELGWSLKSLVRALGGGSGSANADAASMVGPADVQGERSRKRAEPESSSSTKPTVAVVVEEGAPSASLTTSTAATTTPALRKKRGAEELGL